MACPTCGQDGSTDELPVGDQVFVFACERCTTGVLRTFAAHDPDTTLDEDEVA